MDVSQLLRALGLDRAYQAYQQNIGEPFAAMVGGAGRGYLGLDKPEYGGLLAEESYRTGQALGNMPALGAPAGAFKAAAQIPGLLEAAGTIPAIFIGPKSRLWNKTSAETFETLEKSGVSNKDAYLQTGTFRSPDGMLRQEISDQPIPFDQAFAASVQVPDIDQVDAARKTLLDIRNKVSDAMRSGKFSLQGFYDKNPKLAAQESQARQVVDAFNASQFGPTVVGDVEKYLPHQELFSAYPEVARYNLAQSQQSRFNPATNTVEIGKTVTDPRSVALHELQHAIQQIEGFAKGGPYSNEYKRLAGEAEARAVQARKDMPMESRRTSFPLESYDVPIDQLIIRGLLTQ
jgi:hypothetical protein